MATQGCLILHPISFGVNKLLRIAWILSLLIDLLFRFLFFSLFCSRNVLTVFNRRLIILVFAVHFLLLLRWQLLQLNWRFVISIKLGKSTVRLRQGECKGALVHERHDWDKELGIVILGVISVEGNVVSILRNKLIKIHYITYWRELSRLGVYRIHQTGLFISGT